jgi:DNA-binding GntR family transcriptional regulator
MKRKALKKRRFSTEFGPLQRPKSLNEIAYEKLKNSILEGKLVAGEIYSELELARELGVSRTPVREALLKLAAENFVVLYSRRGMSVNYFSRRDIEDLFELRQAVEESIVSKLIENLDQGQLDGVRSIIAEQEECAKNNYDESLFLEIDRRFHLFLIESSGNRFMAQTYNNIRDYVIITARKALVKTGRVYEVINEHKAILDALCEKNIVKAKEAIQKHLTTSKLTALEGRTDNAPKAYRRTEAR